MVRNINVNCIIKFAEEIGEIVINVDNRIKKQRKLSKYNIYLKNKDLLAKLDIKYKYLLQYSKEK